MQNKNVMRARLGNKLEFNDSDKLGNNFDWNIGFDIYYRVNKYL